MENKIDVTAIRENKEPQQVEKLIKREPNEQIYQANLKCLNPDLLQKVIAVEEKIVKIDKDISADIGKNPLMLFHIGFSTRRIYDACKRNSKAVKLRIVIEPDLGVFKHVLHTEDMTDLLTAEKTEFILGFSSPEELQVELHKILAKPVHGDYMNRMSHMESREFINDVFQYKTEEQQKSLAWIYQAIKDITVEIRNSLGCSDDAYNRWQLLFRNLKNISESYNIGALFGKFKDVPAFVLGGGPSLEDFIKQYKANPKIKNCLIIAADAILPRLLKEGIVPHMVTRCERKLTNIFNDLTKEQTKGVLYCAYPWTPPEFFDLFEEKFMLYRLNGPCYWSEYGHAEVNGGVSAANAALQLALEFKCDNIILAGIDLCFGQDGKSHVGGTQVEFNLEHSKDKWTKIKTNNGKEATTIPVWLRCLIEYTHSIAKEKSKRNFKIFNTAGEGAQIGFTEYKPWDELSKLLDTMNTTLNVSSIIEKKKVKLPSTNLTRFIAKMSVAKKDIDDLLRTCRVTMSLADDALQTMNNEADKLIKRLYAQEKGWGLVKLIRQNEHNFERLYGFVSDAYDNNFMNKAVMNDTFRMMILDTLQLDHYQYRNAVAALINLKTDKDEMHEQYCLLTRDFLIKVEHYLEQFSKLLDEHIDKWNKSDTNEPVKSA